MICLFGKKKYVIVSPLNTRGGTIVLHELCRLLSKNGFDARIFYINNGLYPLKIIEKYSYWKSWLKFFLFESNKCKRNDDFLKSITGGCKRKITPFIDNRTIVVYPDMVSGNILHAKKVVRWLLYHYRFKNVENAYDKDDLFICYRDIYNDVELNPLKRKLYVEYFDEDLYKRTNYDTRDGVCYIIRKGKDRKDLPKKIDGIIIDDLSEKQKVEVFNACEYCISYDTQTAYSSIAALCGCISVVIPEAGKQRKDYLVGEEGHGIAYGFSTEEINYAKRTSVLINEDIKRNTMKGESSVIDFIEICDLYFGK